MKYLLAFLAPIGACAGMLLGGWLVYMPVIYAFLLVPLLELFIQPDPENLSLAEEELVREDRAYDFILYLLLPFQFLVLALFLITVNRPGIQNFELIGMTLSMGLLCGIIGINVGHELGHRSNKTENLFAKLFLLSSLYMHFFIEHNRGHHKRVGTPEDPASARYGESLYAFLIRSIAFSYLSAWKLEKVRLVKLGLSPFSFRNQMIHFHIAEASFLLFIFLLLGAKSVLFFVLAALFGIVLLESVNYIEHYGLGRRKREDGTYGKTLHCHSWNSDHVVGRLLLFELSRHSDHHYKASKKYQLLNHLDESPQMPAGYPGMIIIALIPPLWYSIMHPIIEKEMKRMPEIVHMA